MKTNFFLLLVASFRRTFRVELNFCFPHLDKRARRRVHLTKHEPSAENRNEGKAFFNFTSHIDGGFVVLRLCTVELNKKRHVCQQ